MSPYSTSPTHVTIWNTFPPCSQWFCGDEVDSPCASSLSFAQYIQWRALRGVLYTSVISPGGRQSVGEYACECAFQRAKRPPRSSSIITFQTCHFEHWSVGRGVKNVTANSNLTFENIFAYIHACCTVLVHVHLYVIDLYGRNALFLLSLFRGCCLIPDFCLCRGPVDTSPVISRFPYAASFNPTMTSRAPFFCHVQYIQHTYQLPSYIFRGLTQTDTQMQ